MSAGCALRATAACTVRARSAAEMPVLTPSAASIDTVKLVPCDEPFSLTIGRSPSWRQRCSVSVRQISPRPCLAMKLIASGVTKSAASTRSPSFSRSSSSTRMTMRPARNSATMSGIGEMVIGAGRKAGCGAARPDAARIAPASPTVYPTPRAGAPPNGNTACNDRP